VPERSQTFLCLKGVDLGIVPRDTLDNLEKGKGFAPDHHEAVHLCDQLYPEEMQVIAPTTIKVEGPRRSGR